MVCWQRVCAMNHLQLSQQPQVLLSYRLFELEEALDNRLRSWLIISICALTLFHYLSKLFIIKSGLAFHRCFISIVLKKSQ
jgi:hypothetical protein